MVVAAKQVTLRIKNREVKLLFVDGPRSGGRKETPSAILVRLMSGAYVCINWRIAGAWTDSVSC